MLLRLAFLAWKSTSQELVIDYLEKENHKLSQEIGRRQTSIWAMRKDELVRKAREELGMSHADAESETVGQLRLLLKEHAEIYQKPRLNLPKGLTRMTHAQLLEACDKQGIPTEDSGGRLGLKTREMMIRDLKLHARADAAQLFSPRRRRNRRRAIRR